MGLIQEIASNLATALEAGIGLASKIAACGPLGIKTTLVSAHLSIDESQAAAFAKLDGQFGALFPTEDFIKGRNAEAEGRPPSTTASRQARIAGDCCLTPRRPVPPRGACTPSHLAVQYVTGRTPGGHSSSGPAHRLRDHPARTAPATPRSRTTAAVLVQGSVGQVVRGDFRCPAGQLDGDPGRSA